MADSWNTEDELKFISEMVTGVDPVEQMQRLEQYRHGMKLRKDWNSIDKPRIQRAVAQRLYRLREAMQ